MLPRILEPELMDTADDAREYDAMDHNAVNAMFVSDLLNAVTDWSLQRPVSHGAALLEILDLGAGTAQIPIEVARRAPWARITAIDAAESMLTLARENVAAANLTDRITCIPADAKDLRAPLRVPANVSRDAEARRLVLSLSKGSGARPNHTHEFPVVISNSILHHIPSPRDVIAEAIRVTAPGGLMFHRDLCRPGNETDLNHIVGTYAAGATPYQRKLFTESLRAALTVDEMRRLVAEFGYLAETCRATSDRHWTWVATKN